ncbi:hypothetical protein GW17_00021273, partial [Ensete ventricosum]
ANPEVLSSRVWDRWPPAGESFSKLSSSVTAGVVSSLYSGWEDVSNEPVSSGH